MRKKPLRLITAVDLGISYPAYVYNSYGRFYPITKRNEILGFSTEHWNKYHNLSNKEKRIETRIYNEKLEQIYEYVSDYIVRLCPPKSILALEDISPDTCEWMNILRSYKLMAMIIKKAKKNQVIICKVDPRNTSNMCPRCKNIDKSNRDKSKHLYICNKCGLIFNDDAIAAWNIHNRAVEKIFNINDKFLNLDNKLPIMIMKTSDYIINELESLY